MSFCSTYFLQKEAGTFILSSTLRVHRVKDLYKAPADHTHFSQPNCCHKNELTGVFSFTYYGPLLSYQERVHS